MDLLASLNPQQRIAVQHGIGPALVLAGAGSGKTRVIAHRIAYLIRNAACRPENILAVTFTNKAAREMRERVQALIGPARISEPLICTFHSFCVRLLRREIARLGYGRDFSIYDTDDQRKLMKQMLQERGMGEAGMPPREILRRISFAKNHNVTPPQFALRFPSEDAELISALYGAYNSRLKQANALDFDDLLIKAVELFQKFPRQRDYYSDWYRYILVDEYQDTNRPQYELLRLMTSEHENLFVVGDEDQSIYKFRGADIHNILRFEQDFAGAIVIRLEQNYRSTQNILNVASAVVSNNLERKGKTLWTENPSGDVITCRRHRSARAEAEWVCRRILELREDQPDWRAAVLYRANFLSRNFEEVLIEKGVPYSVVGNVAFFGRMEVKDLLGYLRVVFNPEDDIALLRIINTPPRGIGGTTIELLTSRALEQQVPFTEALRRLSADPKAAGRAAKALQRFLDMLDRWQRIRETASAAELLNAILEETGYRKMLERQEETKEAQDRLANIDELLRAVEESGDRGETVFEFLDRAALSSELDSLDPNARVALMTLHSAKGLEFDSVFLVGLEEGLFPHNLSVGSREEVEEERRLFYVGATRARRKLLLTWTPFRRSYGSDSGLASLPSRFLEEMPAELVEGLEESLRPDPGRRGVRDSFWIEEGDEDWEEEEEEQEHFEPLPAGSAESPRMKEQPQTLSELKAYLARQQSSPAGTRDVALKAGMRVRHAQFGDGIILTRQAAGKDFKLTVLFSRVGRKTLVERYAKLQPL